MITTMVVGWWDDEFVANHIFLFLDFLWDRSHYPLPYKNLLTYGRGNSNQVSFPMRTKLMHSPIDFAEFCKKIGCAGRRSFNIAELTRKLKKKLVKTEPKTGAMRRCTLSAAESLLCTKMILLFLHCSFSIIYFCLSTSNAAGARFQDSRIREATLLKHTHTNK